jgi:hypothetical protein
MYCLIKTQLVELIKKVTFAWSTLLLKIRSAWPDAYGWLVMPPAPPPPPPPPSALLSSFAARWLEGQDRGGEDFLFQRVHNQSRKGRNFFRPFRQRNITNFALCTFAKFIRSRDASLNKSRCNAHCIFYANLIFAHFWSHLTLCYTLPATFLLCLPCCPLSSYSSGSAGPAY